MKMEQITQLNENVNVDRWLNLASDKIYNLAENNAIVTAEQSGLHPTSQDVKVAAESIIDRLKQAIEDRIQSSWG